MPCLEVIDRQNNLHSLDVPAGTALVDLDTIFTFGCKAAACGRCQVQVIEGSESLSAIDHREARGLKLFSKGDATVRLACQVKINGPCRLQLRGKT